MEAALAGALVPSLIFVSAVESPWLGAAVGIAALFAATLPKVRFSLAPTALLVGIGKYGGVPLLVCLAVGFATALFSKAKPANASGSYALGVVLGICPLAAGVFLPLDFAIAFLGGLVWTLSSPRLPWVAPAAASLAFFGFVAAERWSRPSEMFLFYQQIHPGLFSLFTRVDDGASELVHYRSVGGKYYLATPNVWISDGGRYVENPAEAPITFARRWLSAVGEVGQLGFGGVVAPELCRRFRGELIDFLHSELEMPEHGCAVQSAAGVAARAHLMVFPPLRAGGDRPDPVPQTGRWTRWTCGYGGSGNREAFVRVLDGEHAGERRFHLSFRSAECVVAVGAGLPSLVDGVGDPVVRRYLVLGEVR